MSNSATASSAVDAEVVELRPAKKSKSESFNIMGLPRIAEATHYERAVACGYPHSYIAARAGRMAYDGEDGLGFFDAVGLHLKVMGRVDYDLNSADIEFARRQNPSFQTAVERLHSEHPELHALFQCMLPELFALPRAPAFEI